MTEVWFYLQPFFDFDAYRLTLDQFLQAGGWVMQVIVLLCLLLFSLLAERYWFCLRGYRELYRQQIAHERQLQRAQHPLGVPEVPLSLLRIQRDPLLRSLICDLKLALNERLGMIRSLIALCPLLGLLGTVSGMIQVFDVLAVSGTGNPRLMAAGIASATLPTLAGMAVSVTGLLLYSYLKSWSDRKQQQLNSHLLQDLQG